jgi:hypothetical protein
LSASTGVAAPGYIHIREDGGRKIQNGLAFWLVLTKFYMFERGSHLSSGGGAEQTGLRAMGESADRK